MSRIAFLRFKHDLAIRASGRVGLNGAAAGGARKRELRAANRALDRIVGGGRAAFGADGLITVRTPIGAIGQIGVAAWALAAEIEAAVGANVGAGGHFGLTLGTHEESHGQGGAASHTTAFLFKDARVAFGADQLAAVGARAAVGIEARIAVGAVELDVHEYGDVVLVETRASRARFFGGQGVVAVGALDRREVDRLVAIRARSRKQPITTGADRCGGE